MFKKHLFWVIVSITAFFGLMIDAKLAGNILLVDAIKNNSMTFWVAIFFTLALCIALIGESRAWNKTHPQKSYF